MARITTLTPTAQTTKPILIPTEWVNDIQLSKRYSVSRATIWRWAEDPEHPMPRPLKIGKNCTRWRLKHVIDALECTA